jgi:hypothetical protein
MNFDNVYCYFIFTSKFSLKMNELTKQLPVIILFLLYGLYTNAQSVAADSSTIIIQLVNSEPGNTVLISYAAPDGDFARSIQQRVQADGNSTETIRLKISIPLEFDILANFNFTKGILFPGDTLKMKFDFNNRSNPIKFEGINAAVNEFVSSISQNCKPYHSNISVNQANSNYLSYFTFLEDSYKCRDSFYMEYKSQAKLPEWYHEYYKHGRSYEKASGMLAMIHQENYRNPRKVYANPEMMLWFRDIALNNPKAIHNSSYFQYLWQYFLWKNKIFWVRGTAQKTEISWVNEILPDVKKELKNPVLEWFLTRVLVNYYAVKQVKEVDKIAEQIMPVVKSQLLVNEISVAREKALEAQRIRFARAAKVGSMAPCFYLKDSMNANYSIERFRGNWTLLSFYDTESLKGNQNILLNAGIILNGWKEKIQLVNIYTDADANFWKKMLLKNNVPGVHLFSRGNWGEILAYLYGLESFPYFVMVDADGIIHYSGSGDLSDAFAVFNN